MNHLESKKYKKEYVGVPFILYLVKGDVSGTSLKGVSDGPFFQKEKSDTGQATGGSRLCGNSSRPKDGNS